MRIAITADNHLTTRAKHPERFLALADIFENCRRKNVQLLIIAGDLFDQSLVNYAEFEQLYRQVRPAELTTVIIPGNHDQRLHTSALAGESLLVYSTPILRPLNDNRLVLFLPYQENTTMGEAIAPFATDLQGKRWILVGHGDWYGGSNVEDPYEKGIYMPLTDTDLKLYQPELVFLGHIHLPQSGKKVHYPGSPCPLNITETGPRRFLILDTARGEIDAVPVNSQLIYFDERLLMLPAENDLEILERDIQSRIADWQLPSDWERYVQVRVRIAGSAGSNRGQILSRVKELFSPFQFYRNEDPDLSKLIHSRDPDRAVIARQFRSWVEQLSWEEASDQPSKSLILEQGLKVIYGYDS